MALVFVYGTLQRGEVRHGSLARKRFVGQAATRPDYRLYNCGEYPGLVEAKGGGGRSIRGELYDVDAACLTLLDAVEGVDEGWYRRGAVRLLPPHESASVEAYFYLHSTEGLSDCGAAWPRRARPIDAPPG